jgi:PKD repeat protein
MITVTAKPHADFTWSPFSPQVCENVTFDASPSTHDGGTIISYEWDFGDNSSHEFGKIVTYTYATYGTYNVTLNVTDSEGKWDIETKRITVRAHPNADFTWSPLQPEEDQTVTFDASASTPDGGTITSYNWNFGDGKFGTGKIITHAYTTAGTYTVTLNVTDSEGKWDAESKQITVKPPPPPPKPVGGCAVPIDKSHLLASSTDLALRIRLAFTLLAGTAAVIIIIRRRKRLL